MRIFIMTPIALMDESGGRHYKEMVKADPSCLSGVLLVPESAAIRVAKNRTCLDITAARYNISPAMTPMRLNQSGAMKIAARSRLRYS
jgi:hypothetical protein